MRVGICSLHRGIAVEYSDAHHPGADKRMRQHIRLFTLLWRRTVLIFEMVLRAGGGLSAALCLYLSSIHALSIIGLQ